MREPTDPPKFSIFREDKMLMFSRTDESTSIFAAEQIIKKEIYGN